MKKYLKFLFLAVILAFALAACGDGAADDGGNGEAANGGNGGGNGGAVAGDANGQQADPPARDLGGMEIVIGNWWTDWCTDTANPATAAEWDRFNDRVYVQERYNFTIREVRMGGWADVRDMIPMEIMGGNRDVHIWAMEPVWFSRAHLRGMYAPIPIEIFEADTGINWNWNVIDLTMRDGMPHGWAQGVELAGGVYFNQRLFQEAGLPPDYPFTLQAEGRWNWDTFTEVARQVTQDFENDGITDTWAITGFHQDFIEMAMASNHAAFVGVDPVTGRFTNTTTTPEFLQTLQWAVQLRDEMLTMHEDDIGGEWNAFIDMFNNAHGAMRPAPNYVAGGDLIHNMQDRWGFVAFPMGPRADNHYSFVSPNFFAIPHFFSPEEVEDIMFAYSMWIRPLAADDVDTDWMFDEFPNHSDPRSVEETMVNFTRNSNLQRIPTHRMVPGSGEHGMPFDSEFAWRIWTGEHDPAGLVEMAQQVWNDELDRVNALLD